MKFFSTHKKPTTQHDYLHKSCVQVHVVDLWANSPVATIETKFLRLIGRRFTLVFQDAIWHCYMQGKKICQTRIPIDSLPEGFDLGHCVGYFQPQAPQHETLTERVGDVAVATNWCIQPIDLGFDIGPSASAPRWRIQALDTSLPWLEFFVPNPKGQRPFFLRNQARYPETTQQAWGWLRPDAAGVVRLERGEFISPHHYAKSVAVRPQAAEPEQANYAGQLAVAARHRLRTDAVWAQRVRSSQPAIQSLERVAPDAHKAYWQALLGH